MSIKVKGMVSLQGVTYRIVRVALGSYSVVRIRDDREVGSFKTAPALGIEASLIEPALLRELSMGMSHDFEIAVQEGATFVRLGTAIFGRRPA